MRTSTVHRDRNETTQHQKIKQKRMQTVWVIFSPSNDCELLEYVFPVCPLHVKQRMKSAVLKEIKILSVICFYLKK